MSKRVIVIGGGAAGLMAAGTAAQNGADTIVLEKMSRCARKLMITGKGRCNLTNNTDVNGLMAAVRSNGKFLYSAFNNFTAQDTMEFFENAGVALKTERGNRVFPVSDKAVDIVDALVGFAKRSGVKILNESVKEIVTENARVVSVVCESGKSFEADSVILATGGKSYPLTGSTGDGYKIASKLGHTIIEPKPSLVGIDVYESFCESLAGLALKNVDVALTKQGAKKPMFYERGEMLFTHTGVSGPLILSASAYIKDINDNFEIAIDLKPALDNKKLDERVLRDFAAFSNKQLGNALVQLLPKSIIPVIIKQAGLSEDIVVNKISKEQRASLVDTIKALRLKVKALRPIEEAIITSGGVAVKEICPSDMQSKLVRGLYFAGEIIDVDAYTGGYNLQIAFSTGRLAGQNI